MFSFGRCFFLHLSEIFSLRPRLVLESFDETVLVPPPIYSVARACDDHDYFFKLPNSSGRQGAHSNGRS